MSKQPKSREKKASAAKTEPKEAEEQPKVEKITKSTEAEKTVEKKAKKEGATKTEAKKTEKPKIVTHGATPIATVSTARGIVETPRQARGFSLPELRTVSLDAGKGRKLGLRVDTRRGTELSQNVEALKSWITPTAAAPKKKSGSSSGKAEEVSEAPAEQ